MSPRSRASKGKKRQKTPRPPARRPKKAKAKKGRGRGPGRPFQPGNPGGPGRPPIPRDYKVAMEDLGPEGVEACGNIVRNPEHPRHADVAMYLVNRWKGTPKARTELSGPDGGPVPVKSVTTSGAKRARVAELLARGAARVKGATEQGPDGSGSAG